MLYEGKTVHDALAQAMGRKKSKYPSKPSTYGKPIRSGGKTPSSGKVGAKPSNFGKQHEEQNSHATSEAIAQAREKAIRHAIAWIKFADVDEGANERAIVYIYDKDTGKTRPLKDSDAGSVQVGQFSSSDRHFRFEFNWRPNTEVVLATAHSHPKANRAGGLQQRQEADRLDRLNEGISRNNGDRRLSSIAPVVIKTPSGKVEVFRGPGGYD